ncbi:MAG: hypothetical protein AAGA60_05070 [Cyanobacteria bacterium P01_E01_bin.42]
MTDAKKIAGNCLFVLLILNLLSLGIHHLCNTPEEQARPERLTVLEEPLALIVNELAIADSP